MFASSMVLLKILHPSELVVFFSSSFFASTANHAGECCASIFVPKQALGIDSNMTINIIIACSVANVNGKKEELTII